MDCFGFYAKRKVITIESNEDIYHSVETIVNQLSSKISGIDEQLIFPISTRMTRAFFESKIARFLVRLVKKNYFKGVDLYFPSQVQNVYSFIFLNYIFSKAREILTTKQNFSFIYNDVSYMIQQKNATSNSEITQFERSNDFHLNNNNYEKIVFANITPDYIMFNFIDWPSHDVALKDDLSFYFMQIMNELILK